MWARCGAECAVTNANATAISFWHSLFNKKKTADLSVSRRQGSRHRGGWGDMSPPRSTKPVGISPPPPGIDDLSTVLTGMKILKLKIGLCEKIVDQIRGVFNFGVGWWARLPAQKSVATSLHISYKSFPNPTLSVF